MPSNCTEPESGICRSVFIFNKSESNLTEEFGSRLANYGAQIRFYLQYRLFWLNYLETRLPKILSLKDASRKPSKTEIWPYLDIEKF